MLEVKNLKKIYKTKNGVDVNALDGVTLSFGETGMVFLLGKSGSGKSTLLNVCGGLDSSTSGEIIVKGRSSKDFTQSDFDSYRNTFVGFIFQEYNILNEFSVEDNIALALELQGKPKDKAAINALLQEVDLQGFAKRKPNTLSGGQKQRIAIARALVKSPEIIMADEPTGALDSNTGKQVFETLKKLSRDKLVIVVSHDRDFAEQYGDRIIELMDGKVISDVTKTQEQQQALSENINTVGDVLCVKGGAKLTDADFNKIKDFLSKSGNDIIIANNEKDVTNFKKVSRINDNGSKEVFRDTKEPENKKQYTKEDSRFIRSKLPLKHAAKIGFSGLRSKPVRLTFTVLLCTVAFTLFGLLSTLNFYDSHSTFKQTLQDATAPVMQVKKQYKTNVTWYTKGNEDYSYESFDTARMTNTEIAQLQSSLGGDTFGGVYTSTDFNVRQSDSDYWINELQAFAYLPQDNALRGNINGAYPQTKNEIVISSYTANVLCNCKGYDNEGNIIDASVPEQIIGKKINISGEVYTITGILDSGEIPEQYEPLKEDVENNLNLVAKYRAHLMDGLHLVAFVNADRIKTISDQNYYFDSGISSYTSLVAAVKLNGKYNFPQWSNAGYISISEMDSGKEIVYTGAAKTTLSDKEIFIPSVAFANITYEAYTKMAENTGENYELAERYYKAADTANKITNGGTYKRNEETGKDELIPLTTDQLKAEINSLVSAVKRDGIGLTLGIKPFDDENQSALGDTGQFTIAGIIVQTNTTERSLVVLSDASFERLWDIQNDTVSNYNKVTSKYKQPSDAVYTVAFIPYEYAEDSVETYWNIYSNENWEEDDTRIKLAGNFIENLEIIDATVKQLSQIFLYIGIVFAVFAALLFSNFISVSISQKKKDIGILRAVGARSTDVFRIFFSESFVIASICIILSSVASIIVCSVINNALASSLGASLFVFGIASFIILVAIALFTAFVATILPVYNAAKKKPVDSIRAL